MDALSESEELLVCGQDLLNITDEKIQAHQKLQQSILDHHTKINHIYAQQQQQLKADLEALLGEYDLNGGNIDSDESSKQERQLQHEYSTMKNTHEELSAQCKALSQSVERKKEEQSDLASEKERLENETRFLIPIKKEKLSLFSNISKILWDFTDSQDEIKGYVSNRSGVKPFCFDKRKCSQFFIVNSLWDSMSED